MEESLVSVQDSVTLWSPGVAVSPAGLAGADCASRIGGGGGGKNEERGDHRQQPGGNG